MARAPERPAKTYSWCDHCRRSFDHDDLGPDGTCPVCQGSAREMRRLSAIVRGLMSNELVASDIRTKHRQLVRMIWTRNGMGERYHRALGIELPYNKFEARVTDLLCQGADAGWVRIVIPRSPLSDESEYRLEFDDDERFVDELEALFLSPAKSQ